MRYLREILLNEIRTIIYENLMNHKLFILISYLIPKIKKRIDCKFQNLNLLELLGMNLAESQRKA